MRHRSLLGGALLAAGMIAAGAARAAEFDGQWSVLVVTDKGGCDRGYRYGVRVAAGRISYVEEAPIDLSGTVSPSGAVKVTVSKGGQKAVGTGKLSARGGSGIWSGYGSTGDCSGHWEAERR